MKTFFYSTALFVSIFFVLGIARPALATEPVPDGSFENFDNTWQCDLNCTLAGPEYYFLYAPTTAADGIYYAYIFHDAGIYQDLTIPSGVTSLSFLFDNQPDDEFNEEGSFVVSLLNVETGEPYTQQLFDQQSDTWIEGSLTIPSELQGEPVRLYVSNAGGFNRIDVLEFGTTQDIIEDPVYPTVTLRVLTHDNQPVKHAKMFIKYNGEKLSLFNLKTNTITTQLSSNKKGKLPKFIILQEVVEGENFQLCVKKKKVKECAAINPEANVDTSYDFAFSSKKVN